MVQLLKFWFILILCQKSLGVLEVYDNREMEAFGKAVTSVLRHNVNEFLRVQVLIFGVLEQFKDEMEAITRSASGLMLEVIDQEHLANLTSGTKIRPESNICRILCVMIFSSLESFNSKMISIFPNAQRDKANAIINFVQNASPAEILANAIKEWENPLLQAPDMFFFTNMNESFIDLITIESKTCTTCNESRLLTLNRFSKATFKWESLMQQLKMIEKLNGSIFDISSNDFKASEDKQKYVGYHYDLLKETAKFGNFKYRVKNIMTDDTRNVTNFRRKREDSDEHDYYKNHFIKVCNHYERGFKQRLIYKELYFVIPPGERYTDWEKLFLAFDAITWYLIATTFAVAFAVIFIIQLMPEAVQHLVFGINVSSPSMNLLAAFFGLSQIVLPQRSFPRFLLMLFIFWSLIFRTAYQGLLFEYLQGDGRKPEIKSIGELLDRNFTYFISTWHGCLMREMNLAGT